MKTLRTLVPLAVAALAAGLATAQAADLPSRNDPYAPAPYATLPSWQGFYVGGHLGGGWGEAGGVDTSGLIGGVQGGYNFQFDKIVAGVEADFTFSGISDTTLTAKAANDWLGSLRARAGYSFGNIMPYVTVGFGFADVNYTTLWGKTSDTVTGWTYGAGAEMMVMPNVSIRAEYLRYELGSSTFPGSAGPVSVDSHVNVLRAGASYKF
ncbi:outer membrane protein [Alsobacter sp. R-9]